MQLLSHGAGPIIVLAGALLWLLGAILGFRFQKPKSAGLLIAAGNALVIAGANVNW